MRLLSPEKNRPRAKSGSSAWRRLLRSSKYFILACAHKARTIILAVIALLERKFAAFANIPYQDALTKQALVELLDEFEVATRTNDRTSSPGRALGAQRNTIADGVSLKVAECALSPPYSSAK